MFLSRAGLDASRSEQVIRYIRIPCLNASNQIRHIIEEVIVWEIHVYYVRCVIFVTVPFIQDDDEQMTERQHLDWSVRSRGTGRHRDAKLLYVL